MSDKEPKYLEFDLKHNFNPLQNGWLVVEVLALALVFVLVSTFVSTIIAVAMVAAWLGGRVVSWMLAKDFIESLRIPIEKDDDNERWYLIWRI